jgi:hypothetical protein
MSTLGRTLDKPVLLATQGAEDTPLFEYLPGAGIRQRGVDG